MVSQHILKKNGLLKLFAVIIAIGLAISVEFVPTQPDVDSVPVKNIQSLTNPNKCANCEGNHTASSKICPVYQQVFQVQRTTLLC